MEAPKLGLIHLASLKHQPNFPAEDLSDENANGLRVVLDSNPSVLGLSQELVHHQYPIHDIATESLREYDIDIKKDEESYETFVLGFSLIEAMIRCIKEEGFNTDLAVRQMRFAFPKYQYENLATNTPLYLAFAAIGKMLPVEQSDDVFAQLHTTELKEDAMKRLTMAERHVSLPFRRPNMFRVITNIREVRRRDVRSVRTTVLGAQVAAELQDPTIAA